MLTDKEFAAFQQFRMWAICSDWLNIKGLDNLDDAISLRGDLAAANTLITKLLENIKLRDDTKAVLVKMQYAIDRELDKRGVTL